MLRNITRLGTTTYDLVVVGGGIYGACAAWEGALRGLKVALGNNAKKLSRGE